MHLQHDLIAPPVQRPRVGFEGCRIARHVIEVVHAGVHSLVQGMHDFGGTRVVNAAHAEADNADLLSAAGKGAVFPKSLRIEFLFKTVIISFFNFKFFITINFK